MARPVFDPVTERFLQSLAKGPALYKLTPAEARAAVDEIEPVDRPAADIRDMTIPCGPRGEISIRIVRPEDSEDKLPVVMYFHGGGWIVGSKQSHDLLVRRIAAGAHAAVVFVNYSLSPEVRHPVALEECYAATEYIAAHGASLNLDGSRLAVAGDSAGGNMATIICMMAKERGGPAITHQVLIVPATDAGMTSLSYRELADDRFMPRVMMEWFYDAYVPDPAARSHWTVSPLNASLDQLNGLPPALVITIEADVLREEGEAYARKLIAAGVPVTAVRYLGTFHSFTVVGEVANTPATLSAIALITSTLRAAFTQKMTATRSAA